MCTHRFLYICTKHKLRHIDTHLATCTMSYTCLGKNSYAKPVLNNTTNIKNQGLICPMYLNKRKRYASKMTFHFFGIASN